MFNKQKEILKGPRNHHMGKHREIVLNNQSGKIFIDSLPFVGIGFAPKGKSDTIKDAWKRCIGSPSLTE